MNEVPQVTIFLTTPEAELFKSYQQFHQTFALLVTKGVFDIKTGQATLNFFNGELQTIEKKEIVWHK